MGSLTNMDGLNNFIQNSENEIEVHYDLPWQKTTADKSYNLTYEFVFAK